MDSEIPIVIIHIGNKEYVKVNLEITGKTNKIYLIGDNSMKHLGSLPNVSFVQINPYRNHPSIVELKNTFMNYSSNSKNLECFCFERVFILKQFMEELKLSRVFHIDSDNILFSSINKYPFQKEVAYCLNANFHTYRMSNSIHCGLLNIDFCNKFINLYNDIYVSKKKFHLIKDKVDFHTNPTTGNFMNGGICDMTLYYILANEKIVDVQNLLQPINESVFINNINTAEGFESKQQYRLKNNMIDYFKSNGVYKLHDEINKKDYTLMNLHFQGGAKRFMTNELVQFFNQDKLIKIGTDYGGWWIPESLHLDETSVVYSGGVGQDMSFDVLLQHKYNCQIVLIDPTKKAIQHFNDIQSYYKNNKNPYVITGNIQKDYIDVIQPLDPNFNKMTYVNIGLWKECTTLKFFKQTNENHVSQTLVETMFGDDYDIVNVNTIKNIMQENNHTKIDMLKLDIEGAEIEVLDRMFDDNIYPSYVLIEFDLYLKNKDPTNKTKALIERMLFKEQYKILKNDQMNITFQRFKQT